VSQSVAGVDGARVRCVVAMVPPPRGSAAGYCSVVSPRPEAPRPIAVRALRECLSCRLGCRSSCRLCRYRRYAGRLPKRGSAAPCAATTSSLDVTAGRRVGCLSRQPGREPAGVPRAVRQAYHTEGMVARGREVEKLSQVRSSHLDHQLQRALLRRANCWAIRAPCGTRSPVVPALSGSAGPARGLCE
jgi:hypothetical protein